MTNYNERLYGILAKHNGELGITWEDPDIVTPDTKQAISSLIKELVAEAKPTTYPYYTSPTNNGYEKSLYFGAIDEFEQNLLKELEEV